MCVREIKRGRETGVGRGRERSKLEIVSSTDLAIPIAEIYFKPITVL